MKIDRQDVLLVFGILGVLVGVGMWSRPASILLGGLMCLGSVWLIEQAKPKSGQQEGKGTHGSAR